MTAKFVVVAGQSNALGYGNNGPAPAGPVPEIQIWNGDHFEMMAPGVNTGTAANPHAWGPAVSFAASWWWGDRQPGDVLYILQSVKGSTGLAADPDEIDWNPHTGEMFSLTSDEIAQTGMAPDLVLWVQGEADAMVAEKAAAYQANLAEFFWNARFAWGNPDVNFVYSDVAADLEFSEVVRQGQAANNGGQSHMVSSDGLTFQADNLHIDAAGHIDLGFRFWDEGRFLL